MADYYFSKTLWLIMFLMAAAIFSKPFVAVINEAIMAACLFVVCVCLCLLVAC